MRNLLISYKLHYANTLQVYIAIELQLRVLLIIILENRMELYL